jgi:hypothetical protein
VRAARNEQPHALSGSYVEYVERTGHEARECMLERCP